MVSSRNAAFESAVKFSCEKKKCGCSFGRRQFFEVSRPSSTSFLNTTIIFAFVQRFHRFRTSSSILHTQQTGLQLSSYQDVGFKLTRSSPATIAQTHILHNPSLPSSISSCTHVFHINTNNAIDNRTSTCQSNTSAIVFGTRIKLELGSRRIVGWNPACGTKEEGLTLAQVDALSKQGIERQGGLGTLQCVRKAKVAAPRVCILLCRAEQGKEGDFGDKGGAEEFEPAIDAANTQRNHSSSGLKLIGSQHWAAPGWPSPFSTQSHSTRGIFLSHCTLCSHKHKLIQFFRITRIVLAVTERANC